MFPSRDAEFGDEYLRELEERAEYIGRGNNSEAILVTDDVVFKRCPESSVDQGDANIELLQRQNIPLANTYNTEHGSDLLVFQEPAAYLEKSENELERVVEIIKIAGESGIAIDPNPDNFGVFKYEQGKEVKYLDTHDYHSVRSEEDLDADPFQRMFSDYLNFHSKGEDSMIGEWLEQKALESL